MGEYLTLSMWVLISERGRQESQRGERCDNRSRHWSDVAMSQGTEFLHSGKGKGMDSFPHPTEGMWLHLDFCS